MQGNNGGGGWIRTIEAEKQQIYSLPPLATRELLPKVAAEYDRRYLKRKQWSFPLFFRYDGAGGRTRTPDLLITNQLLYQLSYTSLELLQYSVFNGLCYATIIIISHLIAFVKPFFQIFSIFLFRLTHSFFIIRVFAPNVNSFFEDCRNLQL